MEYININEKKCSNLGICLGCVENMSRTELVQTIRTALKNGVTVFDLNPVNAASFEAFGEAISGFRKDAFLLVHFDLDYTTDLRQPCGDPAHAMASAAGQMQLMRVDYMDAAVIGCSSQEDRLVWEQIKELKTGGVVHHVILSAADENLLKKEFDPSFMDLMLVPRGKEGALYNGSAELISTLHSPSDLKDLHLILKNFGKAVEDKQ